MLEKSERGAHNVLFLHSPSLSVHFFLLHFSWAQWLVTLHMSVCLFSERERERERDINTGTLRLKHSALMFSQKPNALKWQENGGMGKRERGCGWLDVWEKDGVVCV